MADSSVHPRDDWKTVRLSEICEFNPAKSISRATLNEDDLVSFVPMNDLGELVKYFEPTETKPLGEVIKAYTYFANGDVLCAKITPCFENGKLGIAKGLSNGVGFGSSEFVVMRAGPRLLPEYLFYFLARDEFREAGTRIMSGAVGHKRVPKEYFENLPVPLPPLEEQKRIVAVLDQAFAALDRARANSKANLADAKELFEQVSNAVILGQGLEDHGIAMDGRLSTFVREQESRRSDKKFRGPRILSHQDWPKLPPNWCWASPEQLCSHIVDCLHSTPKWTETGELCLRTTNFLPGQLDLGESRFVSPETYQLRISRLEPQADDVLYSREGGILGIACVLPQGVKACLGQRMMQFRLRREVMLPEYFCSVMNSRLILNEVRHHTGGAAAPHLNIGDIRRFPIPVPPLDTQRKLTEAIESATSSLQYLKSAYRAAINDIDALRQSLLQRAFSVQLTA